MIPDIGQQDAREILEFIYSICSCRDETEYSKLSDNKQCDLRAFHSMIGYLVSNYKNPAKTPAIILSDDGADDESRRGRRGKRYLLKLFVCLKKSVIRGGLEFDPTYRQ